MNPRRMFVAWITARSRAISPGEGGQVSTTDFARGAIRGSNARDGEQDLLASRSTGVDIQCACLARSALHGRLAQLQT